MEGDACAAPAAFLSKRGDPAAIYRPLTDWKSGKRASELAFWLHPP